MKLDRDSMKDEIDLTPDQLKVGYEILESVMIVKDCFNQYNIDYEIAEIIKCILEQSESIKFNLTYLKQLL